MIDSRTIATLTTNSLGAVTYMIDPSLLHLAAGRHNVVLKSLLLTVKGSFASR